MTVNQYFMIVTTTLECIQYLKLAIQGLIQKKMEELPGIQSRISEFQMDTHKFTPGVC